ncbi:MAG: cytochrome d ubiquinol oxidase subunit II [Solirubrobacterales bacterium]|nr:cytochrome d ubiquinol oxidase subunit II [Solirubrobacterales bacterium]
MLHLHTLWFVVIAFFWTGFFVLEGFDFGVGMLHAVVGRDECERTAAIDAIGPFWDANEVWLVVAGAGMFAAFPGWYATAFSALYLALLIVLAALMLRGVSFEFRSKLSGARWRRSWRWAAITGSALAPLLLGIGLGDLLNGLPVNSSRDYTGNFFDLFTGYGIWTGVTLLVLSAWHGAIFLSLKTTGPVRERSHAVAGTLAWGGIAMVFGFTAYTRAVVGPGFPSTLMALAVLAVLAAAYLVYSRHEGWAFAASALVMATVVGSIFIGLYPNLLVSSTNAAYNLTVSNSSSAGYALTVMTIVAVIFVPVVLLYETWSYHVFRARVSSGPVDPISTRPAESAPVEPRAGITGARRG